MAMTSWYLSCVLCHPAPDRRDRSRWFECDDKTHDRAGRAGRSSGPVIVTADPIRHDRGPTGSFLLSRRGKPCQPCADFPKLAGRGVILRLGRGRGGLPPDEILSGLTLHIG